MPKIAAPTLALHRELRRQQLISAAMELALADGAQSITVSAVAAKAGLGRSSIYEYFASSADLVADLVLEELQAHRERITLALTGVTDPFLRIELWISESLRYVADGRHMLVKSLNTISTPENRKEEIQLGHRQMIAPLHQSLLEIGTTDVKGAASLLASVVDAASIRIDAGYKAEPEIQSAIKFALAGLRALTKS